MSNTLTNRKRSIDQVINDNVNKNTDTTIKEINDQNNIEARETDEKGTTAKESSSNTSEHQQKRRGQRIFGVLLGTLNKFKDDSLQEKDLTKKRQAINNKLQERLLEEKKTIRESLLREQENKAKLRAEQDKKRAQKKMYDSLVYKQSVAHYLITETKQHLKYLPKKLLTEQQEKIDQQIKKANEDLEVYKKQQEKEMNNDDDHQEEKDKDKDNDNKDNNNSNNVADVDADKKQINNNGNEDDDQSNNDNKNDNQNNHYKEQEHDHASNDNQEQTNDQTTEHQREEDEAVDYEG